MFIKRSLAPGHPGIDDPLFYRDKHHDPAPPGKWPARSSRGRKKGREAALELTRDAEADYQLIDNNHRQ
jgi:hypothetical protein